MPRVKLYRLNEEGLWDDKGTGQVTVEVSEVGTGGLGGALGVRSMRGSGRD